MDKDFFIIDSEEEALIKNCMKNSYHIPGIIGLIGLSNGGIAKSIIFSTVKLRQYNKIFLSVDPYGSMPHYKEETLLVNNNKFNSDRKNTTLRWFYNTCLKHSIHSLFIQLDNREFFKRYSDGVPYYHKEKRIINSYSFVILSGNNCVNDRLFEFEFFRTRMPTDSMILFTNINSYPHMEKCHDYILSNLFVIEKKLDNFICYKKIN